MEDNQTFIEISHTLASHGQTEGNALSDAEKAEALAESIEAQFQLASEPSVLAVIEVFDKVMQT